MARRDLIPYVNESFEVRLEKAIARHIKILRLLAEM